MAQSTRQLETQRSPVVVLNGAPRSGKTTIANALVNDHGWLNLGVDERMARTPVHLLPGIGLRPGRERPDLEGFVVEEFEALYSEARAAAMAGSNVVVDIGHHDDYSRPLGTWELAHELLDGCNVLWVGVQCSLDETIRRRQAADGGYLSFVDGEVAAPVVAWQTEVHRGHVYDLDVDTSASTPFECVDAIHEAIERRGGDRGPSSD